MFNEVTKQAIIKLNAIILLSIISGVIGPVIVFQMRRIALLFIVNITVSLVHRVPYGSESSPRLRKNHCLSLNTRAYVNGRFHDHVIFGILRD